MFEIYWQKKANMKIVDLEMVDYHGGSIRVYAKKSNYFSSKIIKNLIKKETQLGVFDFKTYYALMELWTKNKLKIFENVSEIKSKNGHVIAVGAAAKGNTMMNFAGIRPDLIHYVVDKNPAKQGKYMPGSRIPIKTEEYLRHDEPNYIIILPWNLKNEVIEQLEYIKQKGTQFVTFIPAMEVI